MDNTIQSVGKAPHVTSDRVALIFDKATGKILHVHRVTVARQHQPHIADDELRHRALAAARKFIDDEKVASADVLHVEPEELHRALSEARGREGQLHVDVAGRRLMATIRAKRS